MNCNKENVSKYDYIYQAKHFEPYKMGVVKNIKNKILKILSQTC